MPVTTPSARTRDSAPDTVLGRLGPGSIWVALLLLGLAAVSRPGALDGPVGASLTFLLPSLGNLLALASAAFRPRRSLGWAVVVSACGSLVLIGLLGSRSEAFHAHRFGPFHGLLVALGVATVFVASALLAGLTRRRGTRWPWLALLLIVLAAGTPGLMAVIR